MLLERFNRVLQVWLPKSGTPKTHGACSDIQLHWLSMVG